MIARVLAVSFPIALLIGCHGPAPVVVRSDIAAPLDALPAQQWADLIVRVGSRNWDAPRLAKFATQLESPSAAARKRALILLEAAGPASQPYVLAMVARLTDRDSEVRTEAASAIDAAHSRSPTLIAALLDAATADTARSTARRISSLVGHMNARPRISASEELSRSLHDALTSADKDRRIVFLRLASRTNVGWAVPEFLSLLNDQNPQVRSEAAWALAATGDTSPKVIAALKAQAHDSVKSVRDDAPYVLNALTTPEESSSPCSHRPTEGLIQAVLSVEPSSRSLKADPYGVYTEGRDRVSSSHSYAYNLLLSNASNSSVPTIGARENVPAVRSRALTFDLTRPIRGSGAQSLGVFTDSTAEFHTFFYWDRNHRIWNTRDIPVGATVKSSRTEFVFTRGGRTYHFHFGPWSLGDCKEPYATAGPVHGSGTTQPEITRLSATDYIVSSGHGGVGRLWEYPEKGVAKDRGRYSFEFVVRIHSNRQSPAS